MSKAKLLALWLLLSATPAFSQSQSYGPAPFTGAVLATTPADPTSTTSATNVMMGLGSSCTITPKYSSRVFIGFVGSVSNTGTASATAIRLRQGTGAAPANGAAGSGNQLGNPFSATFPVSQQMIFNMSYPVTGLTPGVAIWFDIAVNTGGTGTGIVSNITCFAFEY